MEQAPKINGFEILEMLPRGGMSTVYKARQISLDRIVALKTLPPTLAHDAADIEKFIFEARITASLKHPNIVQVYDFGQSEEGIYYFVMEFVSGYSVANWIRRKGRITGENTLLVAQSVAEALKYAWEREKVIHCDVKPDNIIIDSDGTIKVADLGLAKSILSVSEPSQDEAIFGTPNYISPEQSRGDHSLDCRADIYSLGATIYHCVTGKMPFEDFPPLAVMDMQCTETIPDPLDFNSELSTGLACLVEKMMAKTPELRQKDWAEVIRDIIQVRSEKLPAGDFHQIYPSTVRRGRLREQHLLDIYRLLSQKEQPRPDGLPERRYLDGFWLANKRQPHARAAAPVPRPNTSRIYEKAAAVGLAAIVALLIGLIARHFRAPTEEQDIAVTQDVLQVEPAAQEKTVTAAETDDRERLARELFDATMQWLKENSTQYEEALGRLDELADATRGTRYSTAAQEEAQKLQQMRQRDINRLLRELRAQADQLGTRELYQEAAAVFSDYDGALADATTAQREARAAEWLKRAGEHNRDQQTRQEQQERDWEALLARTADALLNDEYALIQNELRSLLDAEEFFAYHPELRQMERLAAVAGQLEQRLLASFQRQKGLSVEVRFDQGSDTLTITRVTDDRVMAEKTVRLGAGYATHPRQFTIEELAMEESLQRLDTVATPQEAALMKGLLAFSQQDYPAAEEYFTTIGPPLAEPLLQAMQTRQVMITEQTAARELVWILNQAQLSRASVPPPPDQCLQILDNRRFNDNETQFLARAAEAFTRRHAATEFARRYMAVLDRMLNLEHPQAQTAPLPDDSTAGEFDLAAELLRHNPGLKHEEITLRSDEAGRILAVEIISPALRHLGPLASAEGLEELVCSGRHPQDRSETIILAPLEDITHLQNLPLRRLTLAFTRIRDLTPLTQMPALTHLNLRQTEVTDMAPLAGLSLQELDIAGTGVR
ncbi:MAG: protein kinase, partial [Lentisphaerae bacterium]|nr:protein kinase [Lentisphaerota bacterium]